MFNVCVVLVCLCVVMCVSDVCKCEHGVVRLLLLLVVVCVVVLCIVMV